MTSRDFLKTAKLVFWDFDGVIKDSVEVKAHAFARLFYKFDLSIVKRIEEHHKLNGGMSRFDKVPLYLRWVGVEPTKSKVDEYCLEFSRLILRAVVDSPWVPGVEKYIRKNAYQQIFVLISATPKQELEVVLNLLGLLNSFSAIFGAPITKEDAILKFLSLKKIQPCHCLFVGDARMDIEAAKATGIPFLLRRHKLNEHLLADYRGPFFKDITSL